MFVVFIPVWAFLFFPALMALRGETQGFLRAVGTLSWGLMMTVFTLSHMAMLLVAGDAVNPVAGGLGLLFFLVMLTQFNDVAQFTTVFATDVAYAGYGGMRGGDGTGTLSLSGVAGSVTEAYLYWQGPTNTDDTSANATVSFAGSSVTGSHIGTSDSNCWSFDNSQAYRADVTSLVSGNGDYALADMIKPGTADISGASLIVFYDDGDASNNRDVVLFDGKSVDEVVAEWMKANEPRWKGWIGQ